MKNKASSFGMYPWNFHSILLGGFQFQQIFVAHPIRVFKGCIICNSVLNCLSLSVHYYFDLLRTSASVVTIFHQTERRTFMLLKSAQERRENNLNAKKYQMTLTRRLRRMCVCVNPYPLFVCICVGVCLLSIFKWIHL